MYSDVIGMRSLGDRDARRAVSGRRICGCGRIEFSDELFELGQEVRVVVGGMSLHHLDDLAIAFRGFFRFLAFFVDHP